MALVAASINITFNANYAGCHRVCWRVQSSPPSSYDCTIQVNCVGSGNSCSATIPIMVDNASCDPVTFEGYVQACCEDINSPNGQLPFSVTFTPNPSCKGYTITCIGPVSVSNIYVTNPGSGYVAGATIAITISGGGGSGATATALIGDGGIDTASVSSPGSGYTDGYYPNVPAQTLTGSGSGAFFNVTVSGGVVTIAIVISGSNGSLYNPGDTFNFSPANIGGTGSGLVIGISTVNTGQVQSITITNGGSGYTSQAIATFPTSGGGLTATGEVIMGPCPTLDLDTCGPSSPIIIPNIPLNTSFVACSTTPLVLPSEYTVDQNSCCFDCIIVGFDKPDPAQPSAIVYYEDCTTGQIISTTLNGGGSVGPVCAITNSWFVIESNPVIGATVVTVGAACP